MSGLSLRRIAEFVKPDLQALGYALFIAITATSLWGGVFPFLPLTFQTPRILNLYFFAQASVFSASYFLSALGAYFFPGPTRKFLVILAALPYFLGWSALIAAIYIPEYDLGLVALSGALTGLGTAGFFMLWQRIFASQEPEVGNRSLILGAGLAAFFYFALFLIPRAVTAFLIPVVFMPLFALVIVLRSRDIDRDQPMFEDVPREHPRVYKRMIKELWRTAVSIGAIGFCTGILRALAITTPELGSLVNGLSMVAMLVGAFVLLVLWELRGLNINLSRAYRFFFPFVISIFALLPFVPTHTMRWIAGAAYVVYAVIIMLMMVQSAQISRDRGLNPIITYGLFGGVVYLFHDIGYIGTNLGRATFLSGDKNMLGIAMVAIYLLGLMYFVGQGGFRSILKPSSAELIEFIPRAQPLPHPKPLQVPVPVVSPTERIASATHPDDDQHEFQDRISKQAELVRQTFSLTARETEVAELMARGNTVARIAEELYVSENTIRTHSKRIYTKLSINKRQELLDVFGSFEPSQLDAAHALE